MLPSLSQSGRGAMWRSICLVCLVALAALTLPMVIDRPPNWALGESDSFLFAQADDAGVADDKASTSGSREKVAPVSSGGDASVPVEYWPRPTKDEERILKAFALPTTVEFLDLPIEDCITFLKEYHHINVVLNKSTLADEGVALDTPMNFKVKGIRFESVLNSLLRPLQLDYVIEDEMLTITTKAKAAEVLITRTYPISDLCAEFGTTNNEEAKKRKDLHNREWISVERPTTLDSLMEAIESSIEPKAWKFAGGLGTMTPVGQAGSLVIRQTWRSHREILQLLRDLREAKRAGPAAPVPAKENDGK